jgi:O-antigen/teichoic acid export membrane protein
MRELTTMLQPMTPVTTVTLSTNERVSMQRNFAWTVTGNVVYAACQWGILIVIAKLGTPTMMGQFALGLAVSAPVFMLTSLQLRTVLATDARDEYRLGNYLALRVLGTTLGLVAITGFVLVSGLRKETAAVVLLVSLAKASDSMSDIIYGFWQKHEHFDKIAIALGGRGLGSVAAMGLVLYLTRSIVWSTAAMAVVWALWLATYERSGAKHLLSSISASEHVRPEWDRARGRQLVLLALPLGIVMLMLSLNANIPRYFIEHYFGEAMLGYFAAMAYVSVAGNTIMSAMGQTAVPRLARYFHSDRPAFLHLLKNMILLGAVLGIAGVGVALFFGSEVLRLLYRADYAQYPAVFTWLMAAAAVAYVSSMLGYGITAARMFRPQVPLVLGAAAITTAACWILIPSLRLMGSAYAVLMGAVFSLAGSAYIMRVAWQARSSSTGNVDR